MNLSVETRLGEELGRYLDLATSQIKLTAANMANIDTPGYRAVGMDFEAEMRGAMQEVDGEEFVEGPGGALNGHRQPRVRQLDGLVSRPDGDDVSMDRESLALAEAQLKFKTGVALLKVQNQMVLDAIHADN